MIRSITENVAPRDLEDGVAVATTCPVCGADDVAVDPRFEFPRRGTSWRIVRCRGCDVLWTWPRPINLAAFYDRNYAPWQPPKRRRSRWRQFRESLAARRRTKALAILRGSGSPRSSRDLAWLDAGMTLAPFGQGRMLDVGCGGGDYLARQRELGWRVAGVEADPQTAKEVAARLSAPVTPGLMPDVELHDAAFDLVTAWEALEHFDRPIAALKRMRTWLAPDGVLALSVPNIDALAARIFGPDWIALDMPRHVTHWSHDSLSKAVQRAGLRLFAVGPCGHANWIRESAAKARGWRRALQVHAVSRLVSAYAGSRGTGEGLVAIAGR